MGEAWAQRQYKHHVFCPPSPHYASTDSPLYTESTHRLLPTTTPDSETKCHAHALLGASTTDLQLQATYHPANTRVAYNEVCLHPPFALPRYRWVHQLLPTAFAFVSFLLLSLP